MIDRPFGIVHSNRSPKEMVGKNQINSVFPMSLGLWMEKRGFLPDVVHAMASNGRVELDCAPCNLSGILRTDLRADDLYFAFEQPFSKFLRHQDTKAPQRVDLVVSRKALNAKGEPVRGEDLSFFEIKLTVLPDNTTRSRPLEDWGSEIVIRPSTTAYAAMSLYSGMDAATRSHMLGVIKEAGLTRIADWKNAHEASSFVESMLDLTAEAISCTARTQRPMLLHSVWTSEIHDAYCYEHAFDTFFWTDAALLALYRSEAIGGRSSKDKRTNRAVTRFCRVLMDLLQKDEFSYDHAFVEIAHGSQTDKETSISGQKCRRYIKSPNLHRRRVPFSDLPSIVPKSMIREFRPERRFDQTVHSVMQENMLSNAHIQASREYLGIMGIEMDETLLRQLVRKHALSAVHEA